MSNYFHQGAACPLAVDNVDTDQIIPKQFLTGVSREGFGEALFYGWRYREDGTKNPDFVLNKPQFNESSVLVAGHNFGCGSSREHAPWALAQFGFKVIVASSFADIFYRNCINNKLLPARVTANALESIQQSISDSADSQQARQINVDLKNQELILANGEVFSFELAFSDREQLLNDNDFIGMAEQYADAIDRYEDSRANDAPWFMPQSFAV